MAPGWWRGPEHAWRLRERFGSGMGDDQHAWLGLKKLLYAYIFAAEIEHDGNALAPARRGLRKRLEWVEGEPRRRREQARLLAAWRDAPPREPDPYMAELDTLRYEMRLTFGLRGGLLTRSQVANTM